MNSWLLIRRLRGPAFIILVGITALLNQWGVLSFGRSWPLYLILAGVLALAERAAVAAAPPAAPPVYPNAYGAYAPATTSPSAYGTAPEYTGPSSESHYTSPTSESHYTAPGSESRSAAPAASPSSGSDLRSAAADPLAGPDRRS